MRLQVKIKGLTVYIPVLVSKRNIKTKIDTDKPVNKTRTNIVMVIRPVNKSVWALNQFKIVELSQFIGADDQVLPVILSYKSSILIGVPD